MKPSCLVILLSFSSWGAAVAQDEVDFSRDIRPILSDRCFKCHGFDDQTREADLGLHTFEFATEDLGGYRAVVPGDPDASELIARIITGDADDVMPPAKANKPKLSEAEVALMRKWIEQGAKYDQHWSFVPPKQTATIPGNENPIDWFVRRRLEKEGLEPSPEADPITLIRRLSLDLIGLPPTPEEADTFAAAFRASNLKYRQSAYLDLVDQLLESKHYGERWARQWLDLARYADTNGYEKDRPRSIWPYRDWVINALNADMPFDQFTIEQLAGDMLPNATAAQRIATGFHRNTMLNEEGGIDPLEYRFHAMVDRVATTGTVWMGLTTGCAQCHTHKYDPITHTDYYGMMALLNNADEPRLYVPDPGIEKRQAEHDQKITAAEAELVKQIDEAKYQAWLKAEKAKAAIWYPLKPKAMESNLPKLTHEGDGVIFASGDFTKRDVFKLTYSTAWFPEQPLDALRLEALPDDRLPAKGPGAAYYEGRSGDFFLSEVRATYGGEPIKFSGASHDFGKIYIGSGSAAAENVYDGKGSTGWSTATREGEPHHLVLNLAEPLKPGKDLEIELLFERHFVAALGKFRISVTNVGKDAGAPAVPSVDPRTATDAELRRAYIRTAKEMAEARKKLESLEKQRPEFPTTLVMQERPADNPRPTHRHHRGEYLKAEEAVTAGVPEIFPPLPEGEPANRLSFAKWLVSDRNPLGARVTVNRAWRSFFGRGLVNTAGDFGLQSELPSHPELLDWLAVEFVERGWSLKELHRLIVTSATYRQNSVIDPELLKRDPDNVLLARGPRFRLDAEIVRDATLRAGGLLSEKLGGPSVYPPQPASVAALAYGGGKWNASPGEDRYRRSLYTFAKRTAPFAAYLTFDGPTGEACIPRRERSNTPLQALTLLNDAMFLESAQALAKSSVEGKKTEEQIAADIFRRVLTREPAAEEVADLVAFFQTQRNRLESGEIDLKKIGGDPKATPELAAWTMVARAVLNLNEAVTRG